MSTRVLFLHGIGETPKGVAPWLSALNAALRKSGRSAIGTDEVVAPRYDDLWADGDAVEPVSRRPSPDARYAFLDRQSRIGSRIFPDGRTSADGGFWEPPFEGLLIDRFAGLSQVRDFLRHPWHPGIIGRVLKTLGDHDGEWLIVAHSLGTAVALELLTQLPAGMRVNLLLTVGSPLGRRSFKEFVDRCVPHVQVDALGGWINVYNSGDIVPNGRGYSSVVPQAVNFVVASDVLDHSVPTVVATTAIASEIAIAFHGPGTKDLGPARVHLPEGVDVLTLASLQLAWHTEQLLKAGRRDSDRGRGIRYGHARAEVIKSVVAQYERSGRALPRIDMSADLRPALRGAVPREQAASLAVALYSMNPIAPFEIAVAKDLKAQALRRLSADLGWNHTFVDAAQEAVREAQGANQSGLPLRRVLVGAIAVVGVAAVIAVPPLIAALGPAGVAGGAAFVGGLAALGPGGMAGGLVVLAGGAGLGGAGLASVGTALARETVDALNQSAVDLLASARTAQLLMLTETRASAEWQILSTAYDEATAEHRRLQAHCDRGAKVVQTARERVQILERALAWMDGQGLGPEKIAR